MGKKQFLNGTHSRVATHSPLPAAIQKMKNKADTAASSAVYKHTMNGCRRHGQYEYQHYALISNDTAAAAACAATPSPIEHRTLVPKFGTELWSINNY
jgi:hypothetical protein